MKRLFAMLLAAAMCAGLICAPASAATAEESLTPDLVETQDIGIVPFAASKPSYSIVHNLAAGTDDARLDNLAAARGSYTITCYITSNGRIRADMSFVHSGDASNLYRSMTVYLYEYYTWYDDGWNPHYEGRVVSSRNISYNASEASRSVTFTGLDSGTHYYILFRNTSHSDPDSGRDISGTITISQ